MDCPACGSERLVRVEFGFPSRRMTDAAERGEIVLGGCVIPDERPDLGRVECLDCGTRIIGGKNAGNTAPDTPR